MSPSDLILMDSLDKITALIDQELRSRREEAVKIFDDLQRDLYQRWMDTDNPTYLMAFVATCSPDQLRELHIRVEKINKDAARRAAFKLIKGGKKDEPKPSTLKGEFNL